MRLTLTRLRPSTRGSLYYLVYWGAVAVYMPFINLYFAGMGMRGSQLGLISALLPLMTLTVAPILSALADRRGWRVRMLSLTLLVMGVALALLSFPRAFAPLVAAMALLALARCSVGPIGPQIPAGRAGVACRHAVIYSSASAR